MKTEGYTANRRIMIPEIMTTKDDPTYVYVPLRGHAYVLAVFDLEDECIGFIRSSTLGHDSVKAWMAATNWIDGGY